MNLFFSLQVFLAETENLVKNALRSTPTSNGSLKTEKRNNRVFSDVVDCSSYEEVQAAAERIPKSNMGKYGMVVLIKFNFSCKIISFCFVGDDTYKQRGDIDSEAATVTRFERNSTYHGCKCYECLLGKSNTRT